MSETLHNRPVAREKLASALKRNMARRKAPKGEMGEKPAAHAPAESPPRANPGSADA